MSAFAGIVIFLADIFLNPTDILLEPGFDVTIDGDTLYVVRLLTVSNRLSYHVESHPISFYLGKAMYSCS